jgi:putative FmdB family regulatory protein
MPIYEYRCDNGHTFEVMQRMSDDPVEKCEVCGAPVHRVFHPVAVHFKGSGFYNTDYGKQKRAGGGGNSDGDSNSSGDGKPKTESSDAKPKKDEAPAAKASSSSSSSPSTSSES